jgi:hypothetical protein
MAEFITCQKCGERNEKDRLFCWVCFEKLNASLNRMPIVDDTITESSSASNPLLSFLFDVMKFIGKTIVVVTAIVISLFLLCLTIVTLAGS